MIDRVRLIPDLPDNIRDRLFNDPKPPFDLVWHGSK
jgi:hypothetical protein